MTDTNHLSTRIAFLHASLSNAPLFEEAATELGLASDALFHHARPDLLDRAITAGALSDSIANEAAQALLDLSHDVDAVVLTCSTLGPAAELAAAKSTVPIIRADAALAALAARTPGPTVVLCTIETTLQPTQALFAAAALDSSVEAQLVPDAWAAFQSGDLEGYWRVIAAAADAAYEAGAMQVVLGQASMAGAAAWVRKGPEPLSVPHAAIAAVLDAVNWISRAGNE